MSVLRRSSRVRKPITSIDQNLNNDDDKDLVIVPTTTRKSQSVAEKRPSCDDDEQELITPKKRQRKKASTTATKTSPYFNTSHVSPVQPQKKSAPKAKSKKSNNESSMLVDENDAGSVAEKSDEESDSDADGWEDVHSKPSEEVIIHKLLKEREEQQATGIAGEVEVTLNDDEVAAAANRKKKKDIHSREHQLELHLKRVIKKTCLDKHQQHIVCNLAHGFDIVQTYMNNLELRALMLSIIDDEMKQALFYKSQKTNMNDIHRLLNYFNELFINNNQSSDDEQQPVTLDKLRRALSEHVASSTSSIRVILFAIFARLLHYECRLAFAADLPPIRPRPLKEDKLNVPHGSLTRNIKKKKSTISDSDETSNSMDDTSRLHSHDHSSDLSRVVASSSTTLIKDNQAISPPGQIQPTLKPRYYWIELYLDDGYIPIDISNSKINSPMEIENSVRFPMLYVWTFDVDSSTQCVKDVTKRYSQKWLTTSYRTAHIEHKTNGAPKWYAKLMGKYQTKDKKKTKLSKAEDQQIENQLARQPVPQSKSELVGHPLYVLKSKILKFEGIYPNDTQPVGWLKEEPIYPRDNLRTLRSKQTWLKEARQVNNDEEPYKIVDGRIKNSARKMGVTTRPQLELFGEWQTSVYEPPEAKDGIVPCNEYGNVDLFQPEMIPRGCVHINEPNVGRICKKLGINFAQAITGFDAHGGMSHPVMEGIVVCQEHEQIIRDTVKQQEQSAIEKEIQKREERIYKHWRKLIRGLIIKQNLARKYADEQDENGKELATDAKYQWPRLPKEDDENAM